MDQQQRKARRGSFLKFLFVSHFCAPVYPGPRFEFHWKHDPRIDQWTWRRWNGKGATSAIVCFIGVGASVIGSRILFGPTDADWILGLMACAFLPLIVIRFGSFTTLIVDSTGTLHRVGSILWMRPVVGETTPNQRYVLKGAVSFCARRGRYGAIYSEYWNRPAVWIEGTTDPISHTPVVLAAGSQEVVDAYVAGLPQCLRDRIGDQSSSVSVCFMPMF